MTSAGERGTFNSLLVRAQTAATIMEIREDSFQNPKNASTILPSHVTHWHFPKGLTFTPKILAQPLFLRYSQ